VLRTLTIRTLAAAGGAAVLAALLVPSSGAAASASCTAWGTLPARVALGPHGATIRTTLHGTAGCRPGSLDNGGTATLAGPGRRGDAPMRWGRFGDSDAVTYYAAIERPGTYRLAGGEVQVYDADEVRVPFRWHETSTVVKYRSRITHVAVGRGGVTATVQGYGPAGWSPMSHVRVVLEHRAADGAWRALAHGHTGSAGRVSLSAAAHATSAYRLVSASTHDTWGATRRLTRPVGDLA